nr:cysteinyl-tRNA synthetase [Megavirus caiporensis]
MNRELNLCLLHAPLQTNILQTSIIKRKYPAKNTDNHQRTLVEIEYSYILENLDKEWKSHKKKFFYWSIE